MVYEYQPAGLQQAERVPALEQKIEQQGATIKKLEAQQVCYLNSMLCVPREARVSFDTTSMQAEHLFISAFRDPLRDMIDSLSSHIGQQDWDQLEEAQNRAS